MERRSAFGLPPAWLSIGSGLLLVPVLWVTLWTFGQTLAAAAVHDAFWTSPPVWWFHIGFLLWSITFAGLRGPAFTWLYVFGHEWTHVLFTILCGGRILAWPEVTSRGGHVLASKTNHLIALSPYVFPFYSVLVAAIFFGLGRWLDPGPMAQWIFYAALGFTWGFHLFYTAWMLWQVQSDLAHHGRFFSLVWIFLVNVLVLAALVLLAAPGLEPQTFFAQWWRNALSARTWVERLL